VSRIRGAYLLALAPIVLAVGLHLYEHVALSDNGFSPGFFLWSLLPYAACIAGLAAGWNPLSLAFAASVALAFDLLAHDGVFIHPTSSTAPLILLFMPICNAVLWIPATLLLAHMARRWLGKYAR
jgi:hypothetical protein